MQDEPAEPVVVLREHARKALGFMAGSLLTNGEPALLAQARQARDNAEQSRCHDAIRELRLKGQSIRKLFLAGVMDAFGDVATGSADGVFRPRTDASPLPSSGSEALGLLKDAHLEQQIAVDSIASRAGHLHREALLVIGRQLAQGTGTRRVDPESLPLSPQTLASVFMASCARAGVESGAMLVLSRLFMRFVIDELGPFYAECQALLPRLQEQHEPAPPAPEATPDGASAVRPVETESRHAREAQAMEGGWDAARTPLVLPPGRAMAMPMSQLDGALAMVQEDLLDPENAFFFSNPKAGVSPLPLQELLNDALAASGVTRAMSLPADALEVMRLLRLLFEHVLRDGGIPSPMRRAIRLLEVPLLRLSLRDASVLSTPAHPARIFLAELTAAAANPPGSVTAAEDFPRLLQLLVMRVLGDFARGPDVFVMTLGDLRRYLAVHVSADAAASQVQPPVPAPGGAPAEPSGAVTPVRPRSEANPEFVALVDRIPLQGLIELRLRGEGRRRLRLIGRMPRSPVMHLADETGGKPVEWDHRDLALLVENGEAVILASGATQPPGRR